MDNKAPDAFRTISEVADELDLPQHVLRFWETRFREIKPMKRGGGRRYYRPDDVDLLRGIRHLLYGEGYTIRGVQRILREQGSRFVQAVWQRGCAPAAACCRRRRRGFRGGYRAEADDRLRRKAAVDCLADCRRCSAAILANVKSASVSSRRLRVHRCRTSMRAIGQPTTAKTLRWLRRW